MKYKGVKLRIYPNKEQQKEIIKTFNLCRFLYNKMIEERRAVYEKLKNNRRELYEYNYKKDRDWKEEYPFLREVSSQALLQVRWNVSNAYQMFYNSFKKNGHYYGLPKFIRKGTRETYQIMQNNESIKINLENNKIRIPKLEWIKFRNSNLNNFPSLKTDKIKAITVSRSKTDKFFVSVLYYKDSEKVKISVHTKNKIIGLDMSFNNFFVDDNGNHPDYSKVSKKYINKVEIIKEKIKNVKSLRAKKKLYKRILKIIEHIQNKRKNFISKIAKDLIQSNNIIALETLSIRDMMKIEKYRGSLFDLCWSNFVKTLQYKAEENGVKIIMANKWFASSKLCNICGYKNKKLKLSDRKWICPECGTKHDRDINAAKNLKNYGIKIIQENK